MSKKKIEKKKLNSNISAIYLSVTLIFVIGFSLFLTSRMYMDEVIPMKYTELNVANDFYSNGKITINDWKYDEGKNSMEIILRTEKVKSFDSDLQFSAISRVDRKKYLDVDVPYKEDGVYIILISNIPKDFEQIALRIDKEYNEYYDLFLEDSKAEEKESDVIAVLYTDQRVVDKGNIETKSPKKYAIQITDSMINEIENDTANMEKSIKKIDKAIEILKIEVSEKEEDKIYQTAEEQLAIDSSIHSLLYKIDEMERDKILKQERIALNEKKIEKLNQKKNDLEIGI